jgi:serine protease Do
MFKRMLGRRGTPTLLFAASFGAAIWLSAASPMSVGASAAENLAPTVTAGFADLVDKVKPAVIGVRAKVRVGNEDNDNEDKDKNNKDSELANPQDDQSMEPFARPNGPRTGLSQGSGFLISSDGYAVTTSHVVEGGEDVEVTTDDNKSYPAKVVGSDDQTDLALLKIDADRALPYVRLAKGAPRIGEWVIAVGNPFGLGGTVTAGIVSARAREIDARSNNDFIQIDAPINEGNSGGPTFNANGEVIGVNSAIVTPSGGSVGIGFAIPADTALAVIPQLKEKGAVVRGWLGVQIQPLTPDVAGGLDYKGTNGAVVVEPQAGSPAEKAGLAAGDIIVSVDHRPISDDRDLRTRIGSTAPGTKAQLEVMRHGVAKTFVVTVGEMPRTGSNASSGSGPK